MTPTPTTPAAPAPAPSDKQRKLIAELAAQIGRPLEVPATGKAASALIAHTVRAIRDSEGDNPAPTPKQKQLVERLAREHHTTYAVPTTRGQASARIAQIIGAGAPVAAPAATQAEGTAAA